MAEDPIAWLYGLERFGVKLGLEAMRSLLDAMGHPESAYPSVLIGGTNGKGSVAATLDAIFGTAGWKAGLTTSPHLVRPNERIRIAGSDISTADLCRHLDAVRGTVSVGRQPSFFEVVTATALRAFREAATEVALLEVGLGGRLDATNVVDAVTSVIVTVDLDHTDRLGTAIDQIAFEKAGIVKPGRPLVTGVEQPDALGVLRETCSRSGSPLIEARRVSRLVVQPDGRVAVETERARYTDLGPALLGRHQVENLQVAVVALEVVCRELHWSVPPETVHEGVARVRWPGRLQWIDGTPPLLLDGAHNPAGARALAEYLRERGGTRPVLLFGAMKEKDTASILEILAEHVAALVLTRARVDRAADPRELAPLAPRELSHCEVVPEPGPALERARTLAGPDRFVLVAGSLHLVGQVLGLLEGHDFVSVGM